MPLLFGPCHSLTSSQSSQVTAGKKPKQTSVRSGSSPHLCLITLVPAGLLGALSVQSRVPEPGVDARAPSGVEWDPASQLSSRTEAPATRMVPEKQKEAPKRGKYLQTLPPLLMKIMKDNAREIGGQPVHRITFQNGRVHTLPVALVEEEAVHTTATPAPGVVGEGHANAAEDNFVVKYCLGFGAAVLVTMLIAMFSCYRLIRQRRQINQRLAEAAEAERIARSYTSRLDRRLARLKALDRKTQHQQPVPLQ
ncbi:uncharacterized protein [Excalfactoria chinensis]|uniref:uncharacterized protein n=1 Tax=Excalfactoria chinensis TaxID=46218 RepID=UPI003B3B810B